MSDLGAKQVVGGVELWRHRDVHVHPSTEEDAHVHAAGEPIMEAGGGTAESAVDESSPGREEVMRLEAEVENAKGASSARVAQETAELSKEVASLKSMLEDAADETSMIKHERDIAKAQVVQVRCERDELANKLSEQVT